MRKLILMALVIFALFKGYTHVTASRINPVIESDSAPTYSESSVAEKASAPANVSEQFQCAGKVYCSEMASCEEANFYAAHCPGTKMDGDHDGKVCEDRCGH